MILYALDSDILGLFFTGDANVCRNVFVHATDEIATTVITVEEQLSGWYSLLRRSKSRQQLARTYERLAKNVEMIAGFRVLTFSEKAIDRYDQLRQMKLGIKKMDLRIAAITLEHGAVLVTR